MTLLPTFASAKDSDKTYPISGKVVGTGQDAALVHGANKTERTVHYHTYKVETESRIYELEFEKGAIFSSTGKDLGGDQPLDIGSEVHIRIEKGKAYLQLPEGKEAKLRILSEDAKPAAK